MWPRRTLGVVTMLGLTSVFQWACTGATPRDQNFGKDAGRDFEAPLEGIGGSGGNGTGGSAGTGGDTGTGGAGDDESGDAGVELGDSREEGAPRAGVRLVLDRARRVGAPGGGPKDALHG